MNLAFYLAEILKTHFEILNALKNNYSLEILLEALDSQSKISPEQVMGVMKEIKNITAPDTAPTIASAFTELDNTVSGLNAPEKLEPYIWSYPGYRKYVETDLDLQIDLKKLRKNNDTQIIENLINGTIKDSHIWLQTLTFTPPIPDNIFKQVDSLWLKFRTQVLKQMGINALSLK